MDDKYAVIFSNLRRAIPVNPDFHAGNPQHAYSLFWGILYHQQFAFIGNSW